MKKHSLFKFMAIILLIVLIMTYSIPARAGDFSYLPFGDIITNYIQSYYYFFDTVVFVLIIGAFYGVLNKTDSYKKLLNSIVSVVKNKSKFFVFTMVVIFALLVALTGIINPLLIFVPFVITIILLLGYDKLVAISATIVSMLVGFIGGVFITFRDPSNIYGFSVTTFSKLAGVEQYSNIIPQIILLVLGIAVLILFINKHIKDVENKKVKYELNDNNALAIDNEKTDFKNVKTWPLVVVFALLLVLLILGLIPWTTLFNISVFTDFHTWLTELSIKEFPVFKNVISSVFPAFGNWAELGSYMMSIVVMLVAIIVIKFTSKIKFNDLIEYASESAKKMLPTAGLLMLAYTVLVCTYNNGFIETIISKVSGTNDINFVVSTLITMIGSLLHVDLYYTVAGVFTPILGAVADDALLNVFALSFQSLYGLVNIIGPTSLLLIFALSYLDVTYTTWVKYIWRFILSLFIVIFAVLLIVSLI